MAATVLVVGNPGLDTLVLLPCEVPDLSADGYFTRNVDTVGGAASYVARGAAALGHRVRLLGSIGADPAGATIRSVLTADGVDCSWVFPDAAGSTRSVNLITTSARRIFFFDGASHMTQRPDPELVRAALNGIDLVISTLANWARDVLPVARAAGIPVAVDLQDVRDPHDEYRRDFIANADFLFASAAHLPDPLGAGRLWLGQGPARAAVFGLGPAGALLVPRNQPELQQSPPPSQLPVVDTTGAGDGLATGFLDGLLLRELEPAAALERGQRWARITASAVGGDHLAGAAAGLDWASGDRGS